MELAPLTYHAVPLHKKFSTMEEVLKVYCLGTASDSARERLAILACVCSMFFHFDKFQKIDLKTYISSGDSVARLCWACLFAMRKTHYSEKNKHLQMEIFIYLQDYLPDKLVRLFISDTSKSFKCYDEDDYLCCICANSALHCDIYKCVML